MSIGRPLVIDDTAKLKAQAIMAHADKHHYKPDVPGPPPGDDPNFVTNFNDYRTVFSFTEADGVLWRHLSVSIPSKNLPNPIAVFMIAELFGFTGWELEMGMNPAKDWHIQHNKRANCIVVAEPIGAVGKTN